MFIHVQTLMFTEVFLVDVPTFWNSLPVAIRTSTVHDFQINKDTLLKLFRHCSFTARYPGTMLTTMLRFGHILNTDLACRASELGHPRI